MLWANNYIPKEAAVNLMVLIVDLFGATRVWVKGKSLIYNLKIFVKFAKNIK